MSLFVSCVVSGGRTLVTAFATLVTRIQSNTCRYPHTRLPVWDTNGSFNIALQSDCFVLSVNLHNSQSVVLKQVCLCREENTVAPARVHVSSQPGVVFSGELHGIGISDGSLVYVPWSQDQLPPWATYVREPRWQLLMFSGPLREKQEGPDHTHTHTYTRCPALPVLLFVHFLNGWS